MKPKFFLFFAVLLICQACSRPIIPLLVLQPADMIVPEHIQTIVTIDRSKPEKGFSNFLEGLITGESIAQDRNGRKAALEGLAESLSRTPRFNVKHSGMELIGSRGGNSFAAPLDWRAVEQICRDYGAQALITIETYDSDNLVTYSEQTEKKKDKDGKETIHPYFNARLEMTMRIGWRFYDPKTRVILDEYTTTDRADDTRSGDTKELALRNLSSQTSITRTVSRDVGTLYGMRVAPVWITVNRTFYGDAKGNAAAKMEQAARFAKADQWDKSAEIWRGVVGSPTDEKTAGKAAFNLAVANERAGQLESALEWAQRAYTEFGNKNARTYIVDLKNRLSDQARLKQQMKEKV